ncbi:hypothetical protein KJ966_18080 [bacterium]|nr:hypothetical protein [bacterium]
MGKKIAFFVSPHGFGHAARVCGVVEALTQIDQSLEYCVITTVPKWFFEKSLHVPFSYYPIHTDIGLAQKNPLEEDLPKTLVLLENLYPLNQENLFDPMQAVMQEKCDLIVCDIAPMGIEIGRNLGLTSVLVENFTWDWIYRGYKEYHQQLERHIVYLENLFNSADYRIIAEPYCKLSAADIVTKPISRRSRIPAHIVREELEVMKDQALVILTMGGVYESYECLNELTLQSDTVFLIPGGGDNLVRKGNVILLPHESDFFHPDLIHASDAVIGKIGYSTLAEVYQAGKPYGYISREGFRESELLKLYIEQHMNGIHISEREYRDGKWVSQLPRLIDLPHIKRGELTGAEQAARFICGLLN